MTEQNCSGLLCTELCKGSGLKFFSGLKNWGQVVNKECDKSHYKPSNAKLNFASPR